METVKSEQRKKFEEKLEKTRKEISEINNERDGQNKRYDRELGIREMKLKEIQSAIDFFDHDILENAMPKYFKIKGGATSVVEAYKTRELIPERGSFKLLADGVFYFDNTITNQSRVIFDTNREIVLGYSLEDALDHISSYYEEITEEEYNNAKKIACEAIIKS